MAYMPKTSDYTPAELNDLMDRYTSVSPSHPLSYLEPLENEAFLREIEIREEREMSPPYGRWWQKYWNFMSVSDFMKLLVFDREEFFHWMKATSLARMWEDITYHQSMARHAQRRGREWNKRPVRSYSI